VGCDLQRKFSAEDRLAGAIHLAIELKLPSDLILKALVCGCHFRATDEAGNRLQSDLEFDSIYAKGIREVLISVCGFDEYTNRDLISEAIILDNSLKL